MTAPREIIVATANKGKLREIRQILADLPLSLSSLHDHFKPLPAIPETGQTFADNASLKAAWVYRRKEIWTLADDSGLVIDALGGRPGVRSARYAGEGAGDRANLEKVMGELDGVPAEKRQARFVCVVALQTGEGEVIACQGACEGRIGFEPRGANGFGYDPVFIPEGFDRTFAELDDSEKNAMSHRGRALGALRRELARRYGW